MEPLSNTVVSILSFLTLISNVLVVAVVGMLAIRKFFPKEKNSLKLARIISNNYIALVLLISATATVGSLALSELISFVPCKLCWYQRAMMYPIAVVSFVALLTNDIKAKKYVLALSIIGLAIAGYHILVQLFPQALECSDEVAKCAAVEFAQYGYITIPVMAFSAFLLIILLSLFSDKDSK